MPYEQFDELTRELANGVSRRRVLKRLLAGAAAGLLGAIGLSPGDDSAAAAGPAQAPPNRRFVPMAFGNGTSACATASTCGKRQYCSADQQCLCITSAEGEIRCGKIPSCSAQLCKTSADCATLGDGYFCDSPNSGCCDNNQRCIQPCTRPECPPERICGENCCPEGLACNNGKCCAANRVCGTSCCAAGQVCNSGRCCAPELVCGTSCCAAGQVCSGGRCLTCTADRVCGANCCAANQRCVSGTCINNSTTATCPSCGTCQACNIDSTTGQRTCGACSDPCVAAALCRNAGQEPGYLLLVQALTDRTFTTPDDEPAVVARSDDGVLQRTVLASAFTSLSRPGEQAILFYGVEATGQTGVYAIVVKDQETQYALTISAAGQVQQVSPPWSSSASNGLVHAASDCGVLCNFACDLGTGLLCAAATAGICSFTGPGALACAWVIGTTCGVIATASCLAICDQWICKEPPVHCFCNKKCYPDAGSCLQECKASLGCFTGICEPAKPGQCSG